MMHLTWHLLLPMPLCLFLKMRSTSLSMSPPTKVCLLDPIPTFLLKDCLDILLPFITKLVNYSLIQGSFPNAFKKAVVTPLPRNDLKNNSPLSGLCLLVEPSVVKKLTSHINNKLDNPHQLVSRVTLLKLLYC